jgi:hypothetical protein
VQKLLDEFFTEVLEVEPVPLSSDGKHWVCAGRDREGSACVRFTRKSFDRLSDSRDFDGTGQRRPRLRRLIVRVVGHPRSKTPNLCFQDAVKFDRAMRYARDWLHHDFHVDLRVIFSHSGLSTTGERTGGWPTSL